MFQLHPRLAADTLLLGELPLCRVLLSKDARYPWVILVPRREGITEIHQLASGDRRALIEESCAIAEAMQSTLTATKMNVASLGNLVPQLHVHHVARFVDDAAWPGPVWGAHPALAYTSEALRQRCMELGDAFAQVPGFESRLNG